MLTTYGDISPLQVASSRVEMLKRGQPHLVIQQFGQAKPLGKNDTKVLKFRRYERLSAATTPLVEGVTPTGSQPTTTPYTATLYQYGDYLELTDVIKDTHTDPVLMEYSAIIGEQAALTVETVAFGILKAGTNVYRANGTARTDINTPFTRNMQTKVVREFKRQLARPFTSKIKSTPSFGTEAVLPSFVCLIHPDLEDTIRNIEGFIDVKDYGGGSVYESELGAINQVRYVTSTVFEAWPDAGGAYAGSGTAMISTSGTLADVYPMIFLAPDAFGIVPLKGANAITPIVLNPMPRGSDPLGQRGSVGWKTYFTAVILNQAWIRRCEVAVPEL